MAEDDADRGALGAQPETPASLSRLAVRRHDPRQEPGAVGPLAGICAGGGVLEGQVNLSLTLEQPKRTLPKRWEEQRIR